MLTISIRYTGTGGSPRAFANEMISSGIVDAIRADVQIELSRPPQ